MSKFAWQGRYDIGVKAMNDEHKVLLSLMEKLENAFTSKAPFAEAKKLFSDLADYTVKHFKTEEEYMGSIGFPGLDSHKMIHTKLLSKFSEFQHAFESSQELTNELFEFLNFWLASHICGVDIKYAEHAKHNKVA